MSNIAAIHNIRSIIEQNGPMSMASFMENVLSHEQYGYYVNKAPIGGKGDFITAPEVSQLFGEMIGIKLADIWLKRGSQEGIALVELGPGKGTLMDDILRSTRQVPNFHQSITVYLLELSKPLIEIQKQVFSKYSHIKFEWIKSIDEIPEKPLYLVANEFFDALPVNQYVKNFHKWYEVAVSIEPETKDFKLVELVLDSATNQLLNQKYPGAAHRAYLEISPISTNIIEKIAGKITKNSGMAIIIDYGYYENNLSRKNFSPTIQSVKDHQFNPIFSEIGNADITAHVDFFALKNAALAEGAIVDDIISQRDFLLKIGIELRAEMLKKNATFEEQIDIDQSLHRLISPDQMGSLFKVLVSLYP